MTDTQRDTLNGRGVAALNPWPPAKKREHARWAQGFGRALGDEAVAPRRRAAR